jgi:hypothetical protein
MKRVLLALVACVLPAIAAAQVDRAILSGIVKDPSGAPVAAAAVTVTDLATNIVSKAQTNGEGAYVVVNLPPGQHLVEVEAKGFSKIVQTVLLEVGQRGRLDMNLAVGQVTETVNVAGVTPLINKESAVLGRVVDQTSISKLPLAIRNWDDLLALVPGVQGDRYTEESGSTATGRTGAVNVHGQRSLNNNFMLDGVDNNVISENLQELSTQVSRPSIDAINEFKVVTSPYSAEFGRNPGAAVSVTTKSGSNILHGTAYDYIRNKRFDSINYFAGLAGQSKPDNDQNQFGGNLGGPIAKDRMFFFFDFEGTRIARGVSRAINVPTSLQHTGDFSQTFDSAGKLVTITDPLTGQAFPGNIIPLDRIDPVAQKIIAMVPVPNAGIAGSNFFRQPNVEDNGERYLGRVDLRATNNDTVFVRYINTQRTRFVPGFFGGQIDATDTSAWGRSLLNSQSLVGGWTKILSASLVNEARISWVQGRSDSQQDPFGQNGPELIGLKGVPDSAIINGGITGMVLGSGFGPRWGSPDFLPKFQHTDQVQYVDTLSWLTGRHAFKFGVDIMAPMRDQYMDIPATRGTMYFNGQFTGNSLSDFLLGFPYQVQLSNVYVVDQRHWATNFFVQDDWKATSKLTLNLGLRYDFTTPPLEAQNRVTNFNPDGAGSLIYGKDGSLYDRSTIKPDRNNFAPRIGATYALTETTVLRGGYGIFYNTFEHIGSEDQVSLNPPGLVNNLVSTSSKTVPILYMRDGFPADFLDPTKLDLTRIRLRAQNPDMASMLVHQFGGGVERQLGQQFVASVDFTGTEGRNISRFFDLNTPLLPGSGRPKPYPNFGVLQWRNDDTSSNYRGLEVAVERRMSKGYSYRVSYTLSRSIDQASDHLASGGGATQDPRNIDSLTGYSDYDTRQRFVSTGVWQVPGVGTGAVHAITEGWLLSGIFTTRTGRPFTVTQGNNNLGTGRTGLPDQIGDPNDGPKTPAQWFNLNAFQKVVSGTYGNEKRNQVRGPSWMTLDMSLHRRFPLANRMAATLRWDVFNLTDHRNFGLPNRDINASNAGTITTMAGDPRIMQFAVRLEF